MFRRGVDCSGRPLICCVATVGIEDNKKSDNSLMRIITFKKNFFGSGDRSRTNDLPGMNRPL